MDLDVRAPHSWYQSICTLDKVRFTLERTGRENPHPDDSPFLLSLSWASKTSSTKQMAVGDYEPLPAVTMVIGRCLVCFLYVLVSTATPRCPRCGAHAKPGMLWFSQLSDFVCFGDMMKLGGIYAMFSFGAYD
ncbi:hypothetical protein ZIOFF_033248 [Zingiber officinale]|uniref:Uncharacterized protein n=1 Tax=Zingiber officinale TaxID=94328 RepID=A0A8J5GNW4_ZINOF|nr:hypothetical protein ZIOFF_033248 [Zingiber officinale]